MSQDASAFVPTCSEELLGDPAGLAEYQFRLAMERCAECRDYHAVWPYRRLSLTVAGIESTADIVGQLFRDALPLNGRILIAGAADAGMLALTAGETKSLKPRIDVADRCPTPLAVCRRYAESQGLSIRTLQLDLTERLPSERYDVVFADCVLQFVPREAHVGFLSRLREAMTSRSALVLVERLRMSKAEGSGSGRKDRAGGIVAALAANRIPLPEHEASFALRLNSMLNTRQTRFADFSAADELSDRVAQAGYRLRPLGKDDSQRTVYLQNGDRVVMTMVVGSPTGD
jgi:hypothetical protein